MVTDSVNNEQTPSQAATDAAPAARLTREDVEAALARALADSEDKSPFQKGINAASLQKLIGRGSFSTVQKHLDAIKDEWLRANPPQGDAENVPPPPRDSIDAIWRAAWTTAHAQQLQRINVLTQEREQLVLRLNDRTSAAAEMTDEAERQEQAATEANAARQRAEQRATAAEAELATARQQIETMAATHAEAITGAEQARNDAVDAAVRAGDARLATLKAEADLATREAEVRVKELHAVINAASEREHGLRDTIRTQEQTIAALQARIADLTASKPTKGAAKGDHQ